MITPYNNVQSVNVDAKNNNCMSKIIKNNYGYNYGTKEYYELVDLIAKENPDIFSSDRKTANDSGKIDETYLYVGDVINLPGLSDENSEEIYEDYSIFFENEYENEVEDNFINDNVEINDVLNNEIKSINVDTKNNNCMSKIIKNNYGYDYGTKEYYELVELIAKENPEIFNSGRKTVNNSGKTDETYLYAGDVINLPNISSNNTETKNENQNDKTENIFINNNSQADNNINKKEVTGEELLKEAGINIDFKIGNSKQKIENGIGKDGDCWLLSGLNSLSYTDEGAEMIKNAMTIKNDGSIDIYFKGIDKTYNVTLDEMKEYNETRFTGDDDVMAFEIATIKFRTDLLNGNTFGNNYSLNYCEYASEGKELWAGWAKTVWEMFTGLDLVSNQTNGDKLSEQLDEFENNKNTLMTIGVSDSSNTGGVSTMYIKNSDNENIKFYKNHAYAVKNVDENEVTLVDPINSSKEIKINKEELLKIADTLGVNTDYLCLDKIKAEEK